MWTTVSRKIILTNGPGDEVVLSAGEETGFLPLVWPACEVYAGPGGSRWGKNPCSALAYQKC
jgi:hypothetical protein